jgi:hypothetical protein
LQEHCARLAIVRVILAVGTLTAAFGLALEILLPASGKFIAIASAISGIATLIVPPLLLALFWNKKPKTAFGGVGYAITILVVAGSLSAMGLSLAALTFVFGQGNRLAWIALLAIAALWAAGAVLVAVVHHRARRTDAGSP